MTSPSDTADTCADCMQYIQETLTQGYCSSGAIYVTNTKLMADCHQEFKQRKHLTCQDCKHFSLDQETDMIGRCNSPYSVAGYSDKTLSFVVCACKDKELRRLMNITAVKENDDLTQDQIETTCRGLMRMLLAKNKRYGNSALEPMRIFSRDIGVSDICIRLDDKLSRIKNASEIKFNDVADIMGYLTLLCIERGWHEETRWESLID